MWLSTAVPRTSNRQRVGDFLKEQGWSRLGASEWASLCRKFPGIKERSLREAVRLAQIEIEQPWAGVDVHNFDGLQQSLIDLAEIYRRDSELRQYIRSQVIEAKDRTRGASRNQRISAEKRAMKAEMVEWFLVWLGDPALFSAWVTLRQNQNAFNTSLAPRIPR